MSTSGALAFHAGETWCIDFSARTGDGVTQLALPGGSIVGFAIATLVANPDASDVLLTVSSARSLHGPEPVPAIAITDPAHGIGTITITPDKQAATNLAPAVYLYELRVQTSDLVSVQATGRLTVLPSLFVSAAP